MPRQTKKTRRGSSGRAARGVVRGQAHAPAPLARQAHQRSASTDHVEHDRRSRARRKPQLQARRVAVVFNPQAVPIPDLLRELLLAPGPSGHEEQAARVWREAASAFAESTGTRSGPRLPGFRGAARPTLALFGHIDEIGITITHIDDGGLLAFSPLGASDAEMLVGQRVIIAGPGGPGRRCDRRRGASRTRPLGPRALEPPHRHRCLERRGGRRPRGARRHRASGAATRSSFRTGGSSPVRSTTASAPTSRSRLRAGWPRPAMPRSTSSRSRSAQEETSHDGARTAAFGLEPDVALVVDVTVGDRRPWRQARRRAGRVELGGGVAITRGSMLHPAVSDALLRRCPGGGHRRTPSRCIRARRTPTPTRAVSRSGVPTGLLGIPLRYMHSPCELARSTTSSRRSRSSSPSPAAWYPRRASCASVRP